MPTSTDIEVERYLRSGDYDEWFGSFPGDNFTDRAARGHAALRGALVSSVRSRTSHATVPEVVAGLDVAAYARSKLAPMVQGLFLRDEQEIVLDMLGRSVVFLTPDTIDRVLQQTQWLDSAWKLANLYLASCGAQLLSQDALELAGLSEGTTCFVSTDYFRANGRFDDFLVHEAAHVFHNCKRRTAGLREIRGREWLLEIDYTRREAFAYACEAYSRILELGRDPAARRQLLAQLEDGPMPPDERVDAGEYIALLRQAIAARNGWRRIWEGCSSIRPARSRSALA